MKRKRKRKQRNSNKVTETAIILTDKCTRSLAALLMVCFCPNSPESVGEPAAAAGLPERDGLRCIALEREAQCVLWQRALQLFYSCTATVGLAMLNSLMATGVKGSSVSGIFL